MSEKKTNVSSSNVLITPKGKKLIQARLPFKTLAATPKVGVDVLGTPECRKRKLSNAEDDNRSIKLSKIGGTKENEVTVLETVDLVEDDFVMVDSENLSTTDLTNKQTKKDVVENETPLKRTSRRSESEVPKKVVIKIPSTKKKKPTERLNKVTAVTKIDDDEDDDVIAIDSEENSLISGDEKEKNLNEKDDLSIVLFDGISVASDSKELDSAVDGQKVTDEDLNIAPVTTVDSGDIQKVTDGDIVVASDNIPEAADSVTTVEGEYVQKVTDEDLCTASDTIQKVAESVTTLDGENVQNVTDVKEVSTTKATDSCDNLLNEDVSTTVKGNEFVPEDDRNVKIVQSDRDNVSTQTNKPDIVIIDGNEEEVSSSSNATDKTDVNEQQTTALERGADDKEMETYLDQSKFSTPTSSRKGRKTIDNNGPMTTPKTSALQSSNDKNLTPKQLQKKLESEQKRLAKEKAKEERDRKIQEAKEERERKLQEEKEQKQKERDEKERQKKKERDDKEEQKRKEREDKEEQRRKEREDKEEQRRKEKEEREKKKQAEIDAKNEEKRQKEEERVAKEEAEMKKKRKEAEAFTKFFAKKSSRAREWEKMDVDDVEVKLNFMPFRVKPDMRLAPIVRRKLSTSTKTKFDDEVLKSSQKSSTRDLYIQSLRNGRHVSQKQGKTWKNEDISDDVIIIDDLEGGVPIEETSAIQKYRAKFFKFEENRRPPYYGTWRKKSSVIKPRKPFVTDSHFFDYEIDSDDEWEDEEPGESLHGSDDEKDKESDDDYDIDNEFFVPHGHLSDEELANNDDIDDDNSPDAQKAKLKIMQKVFSDAMKQKTERIKPRLIGLIWQNKDGSQPRICPNVIWEMLLMRSMIFNGSRVVCPIVQTPERGDAADENNESAKGSVVKRRVKFTEEEVSDLIRLVHGNTNSSEFLTKEFRTFTAQKNAENEKFSLVSIRQKIKELAEWKPCPDEGPLLNKYCWYVSAEQRKLHSMTSLSITNDWNYILTPKTKTKTDTKKVKENEKAKSQPEFNDEPSVSAKTPKSKLGNIAKFTKVLSEDDKRKNFSIPIQESIENASPKSKPEVEPSPKPAKKRVNLLMSVPRGQEIPVQTKNSLISQFLNSTKPKAKSTNNDEPICID